MAEFWPGGRGKRFLGPVLPPVHLSGGRGTQIGPFRGHFWSTIASRRASGPGPARGAGRAAAPPPPPVPAPRARVDRIGDSFRAAAAGVVLPAREGGKRAPAGVEASTAEASGATPSEGRLSAGESAEAAAAARRDVRWHGEPQHRLWGAAPQGSAFRRPGAWGRAVPPKKVHFAPVIAQVNTFDPAVGASDRATPARAMLWHRPRDPG